MHFHYHTQEYAFNFFLRLGSILFKEAFWMATPPSTFTAKIQAVNTSELEV